MVNYSQELCNSLTDLSDKHKSLSEYESLNMKNIHCFLNLYIRLMQPDLFTAVTDTLSGSSYKSENVLK